MIDPALKNSHSLPTGTVLRAVNLHAHSTASDGQRTPQEIAAWAERTGTYIAITDHNSVDAHRTVDSPYVLSGVEVTAGKAAVDVLVYGERDALVSWFDARIAPHLNAKNPTMRPVDRDVVEIVEEALQLGLHVVVPHFAIPDGIGFLEAEDRNRIGLLPVIVELNGQISTKRNLRAAAFAAAYGRPLIAADDTHCGDYGRTLTRVPLSANQTPTVTSFFAAINEHPEACQLQIREPTKREIAALVVNALRKVGLRTMIGNALEKTFYAASVRLHRGRQEMELAETAIFSEPELISERD